MNDKLTTVATFADPIEASIAKNRLESEGVKTVLSDEATVAMAWHLISALGGIKLQVLERDLEQAAAILEGQTEAVAPELDFGPSEHDETEEADLTGQVEPDEPEPLLTNREQTADRALRGAIVGILFWPAQLYVFWLLLKVLVSNEPMRPEKNWKAVVAGIINLRLWLSSVCGSDGY